MADRSNMSYKVGQAKPAKGNAQVKKDEIAGKMSETAKQGAENAGGFLQQTGQQMKQMAESAVEAVKNAAGMGGSNGETTTTTTTNHNKSTDED